MYTAATVLLAERLRPNDSTNKVANTADRSQSWNRAMEILRAYSRVGESAGRCVAALEILSAKIPGENAAVPHQQLGIDPSDPTRDAVGTNFASESGPSDDLSTVIEFDDINFDFDIEDMLWLNSNAADILFQ